MKSYALQFILLSVMGALFFAGCNKETNSDKDPGFKDAVEIQDPDIFVNGAGEWTKVITHPLVKTADCKYIVAGTIEFIQGDKLIATVDFGDGTCDDLATKTVDGQTKEFSLKKEYGKYEKIVLEPLVKTDDCQYIVSGIIQFVSGDKIVATIDFGDGTCDEWATKTWDGGSKVFSLDGKY